MIFVTGGASSGKSAYALKLGDSIDRKLFIATGVASDREMATRIERHRNERGPGWVTIEEPYGLVETIASQGDACLILIDCLTVWISNLIYRKEREYVSMESGEGYDFLRKHITSEVDKLIEACMGPRAEIVIVADETGMSIVPENRLSRFFREISGYANQRFAEQADDVYLLVSGIALKIK